MAGCETVNDVIELIEVDTIIKLMPHQVANHVKDRKPEILAEATRIADEFIRNRG